MHYLWKLWVKAITLNYWMRNLALLTTAHWNRKIKPCPLCRKVQFFQWQSPRGTKKKNIWDLMCKLRQLCLSPDHFSIWNRFVNTVMLSDQRAKWGTWINFSLLLHCIRNYKTIFHYVMRHPVYLPTQNDLAAIFKVLFYECDPRLWSRLVLSVVCWQKVSLFHACRKYSAHSFLHTKSTHSRFIIKPFSCW